MATEGISGRHFKKSFHDATGHVTRTTNNFTEHIKDGHTQMVKAAEHRVEGVTGKQPSGTARYGAKSLSIVNKEKANALRDELRDEVTNDEVGESEILKCTLVIPSKLVMDGSMKMFIDNAVLEVLEQDQVINWHPSFTKVLPISTTSDHNCLCHGVSVGICGAQDRQYTLRQAILHTLRDTPIAARFKAKWKEALIAKDVKAFGTEIERSEEEWEREWQTEMNLAEDTSQSLTEIHIMILAHVIRRPIIVYAPNTVKDVYGEALAPIYFGGIYLPCLWPPQRCFSTCPVQLCYFNSHFTSLVPVETCRVGMHAPLYDSKGCAIPIAFESELILPPGSDAWEQYLGRWLDVDTATRRPHLACTLPATKRAEFANELQSIDDDPDSGLHFHPEPVSGEPSHSFAFGSGRFSFGRAKRSQSGSLILVPEPSESQSSCGGSFHSDAKSPHSKIEFSSSMVHSAESHFTSDQFSRASTSTLSRIPTMPECNLSMLSNKSMSSLPATVTNHSLSRADTDDVPPVMTLIGASEAVSGRMSPREHGSSPTSGSPTNTTPITNASMSGSFDCSSPSPPRRPSHSPPSSKTSLYTGSPTDASKSPTHEHGPLKSRNSSGSEHGKGTTLHVSFGSEAAVGDMPSPSGHRSSKTTAQTDVPRPKSFSAKDAPVSPSKRGLAEDGRRTSHSAHVSPTRRGHSSSEKTKLSPGHSSSVRLSPGHRADRTDGCPNPSPRRTSKVSLYEGPTGGRGESSPTPARRPSRLSTHEADLKATRSTRIHRTTSSPNPTSSPLESNHSRPLLQPHATAPHLSVSPRHAPSSHHLATTSSTSEYLVPPRSPTATSSTSPGEADRRKSGSYNPRRSGTSMTPPSTSSTSIRAQPQTYPKDGVDPTRRRGSKVNVSERSYNYGPASEKSYSQYSLGSSHGGSVNSSSASPAHAGIRQQESARDLNKHQPGSRLSGGYSGIHTTASASNLSSPKLRPRLSNSPIRATSIGAPSPRGTDKGAMTRAATLGSSMRRVSTSGGGN